MNDRLYFGEIHKEVYDTSQGFRLEKIEWNNQIEQPNYNKLFKELPFDQAVSESLRSAKEYVKNCIDEKIRFRNIMSIYKQTGMLLYRI